MDRQAVMELKALLEKALGGIDSRIDTHKYGVVVGHATYNGHSATFKVEVIERAADGTALSAEARSLSLLGSAFGLPEDALHKKFVYCGKEYEAVGLAPKSTKYPLLAMRTSDGKVFKLPSRAMPGSLDSILVGGSKFDSEADAEAAAEAIAEAEAESQA